MIRICVAFLLCCLLLAIPAIPQAQDQAQKAAPQDDPERTIRVSVNTVIVPVTVTDNKGRFVSNLEARDFRVLDEGQPQRIRFFSHNERQPIVVGFLIDQSSNMKTHWDKYKEAILELVWNLLPGDKRFSGYLITYASEAELAVNTTWDSEKLAEKIRKMKPGGGSALYDAIYTACTTRSLIPGEPYEPRRILIVVGDGHDNASHKSLEEVLELAQRNLVTIYGISTAAFGFSNEEGDNLERLSTETGGHVEYPLNKDLYKDVSGYLSNPSDAGNYALTVGTGGYAGEISKRIFGAILGISGEITTQYVLQYNPDVDADVKPKIFRKIKVEVPTLPTVTIRARKGYYPNGVPGGLPSGGQ